MKNLKKLPVHIFLIIASFVSIFPFIWMVIGMTNSSVDIIKGKMTFGSSVLNNFKNLTQMVNLPAALGMSLFIAIVGTLLTLLLCSMAGYGFQIFASKGKERLFNILLLSMTMPFAAIMVPLFRMFSSLKILNTPTAVLLPSLSTAFMIFFFRQNTKAFPVDLLQAARVDGLNEFKAFFYIYFPTMKSTYAAAAIITFMNYWNSFLWPLIVLRTPEKRTLPLVVSSVASAYNPDYGVIMVAIVVSTLPSILIFFIMQKQFVQGMVGAVK